MLKFAQIGGNLMIGDLFLHEDDGRKLMKNPRMVVMQQVTPKQVQLFLAPLVGEPKEIEVHELLFSYEVTNKDIQNLYYKEVTGLILDLPHGKAN